jgi:chitosanase
MYTKNLMLYSGSYGPTGPTGGGGSTGESGGSGPTGETGGSGPGFNYWDGTQIPYVLNGGMSAKQCDTILSLVSIAENSSIDWSAQYKYCEDIGDRRGFTLNLCGFCTGTHDFLWLVQNLQTFSPNHPLITLLPALKAIDGTPSHKGIENLPNIIQSLQGQDLFDYITATWNAIRYFYWDPAIEYCKKYNLQSALAKYIAYDTILNFGEWTNLENIKADNEKDFLTKFLDLKQKIIENDPSLGDATNNRVDMQKKLLSDGNMELTLPMTVSCYGDVFNIV